MIFSGFELKERLIRLRIKSELTTSDVAEYLGIEEEEVINIENGKSPLLASIVDELSKLYGVSVTRLMKDDNWIFQTRRPQLNISRGIQKCFIIWKKK